MRGRRGGIIGTEPVNNYGDLSGLWRASEIYTLRRASEWPGNSITASVSPTTLDTTVTGGGVIYGSVYSTYQSTANSWEKSVDSGETWTAVSGETSESLTLASSSDGDLYRLVVSAGLRVVRTDPATILKDTVSITISSHPQNQSVSGGQYAYFDVSASAQGQTYSNYYTPSYQWQVSTNGGSSWSNVSGQTNYYLYIPVIVEMSGRQYRVVLTAAGQTATSDAATLTVT